MKVKRAPLYNLTAIILPVLCALIGGFVAYRQYARLTSSRAELVRTERQIDTTERELQDASTARSDRIPTVPPSPQEQPEFLNLLRSCVVANGVTLVRLSGLGAASTSAAPQGLPPGVSAVSTTVEVVGPYRGARGLLVSLQNAPRVLNVADVHWNRDKDTLTTRLTFTVERYLSTQVAAR